jgi:hypothetical protein
MTMTMTMMGQREEDDDKMEAERRVSVERERVRMDEERKEIEKQKEELKRMRSDSERTRRETKDKMKEDKESGSLQEETARLLVETVRKDAACRDRKRWGGGSDRGEGAWTLCMTDDLRPPCVIYSLGINNDFSFDDEARRETGCDIHSFDPSMGWGDKRRGDASWFWNTGISGKDEDRDGRGWRMRTLGSVMRELNHTRVNVVKMDIEGDEWSAMRRAISDGTLRSVDQFMVEIHFSSSKHDIATHSEWRRVLMDLRGEGFGLHYFRENPMSTSSETGFRNVMSCCFELSFIRI